MRGFTNRPLSNLRCATECGFTPREPRLRAILLCFDRHQAPSQGRRRVDQPTELASQKPASERPDREARRGCGATRRRPSQHGGE